MVTTDETRQVRVAAMLTVHDEKNPGLITTMEYQDSILMLFNKIRPAYSERKVAANLLEGENMVLRC